MRVCFLGKPGSGKGMTSQYLIDEGFASLPTGELLKKEIDRGTELGQELKRLFADGKLAPVEVVIQVVKDFLATVDNNKHIIFDGFPRSLEQAKLIEEEGIDFDFIVHFKADDDLIKDRILNRLIHKQSGRVYNEKTFPPKIPFKDDITGETLIRRDDDNEETFVKRMTTYYEITHPLLSYYKSKGAKILEVDASKSNAEIVKEIVSFTNRMEKKVKNRIK